MAQCRLFLKEAAKIKRRESALLASSIVACAFDEDAWKKITEGL